MKKTMVRKQSKLKEGRKKHSKLRNCQIQRCTNH